MIYPKDFEKKIGFDHLRAMLTERCLSQAGVRNVAEMKFMVSLPEVNHELLLTGEMLSLLTSSAPLPTENMHDMAPALARLRMEGSYMSVAELYHLLTSLTTISRIATFFTATDEEGNLRAPLLSKEFSALESPGEIIRLLSRILDKYGEIADNASPALSDLRRSIGAAQASVSTVMRRVLDKAAAAGLISSDVNPSMRDGRLVIPVEAAKKRAIPGIVHDESATGKTAFVEPLEVVAASNRLRELREQEKREVIRILIETSAFIRPFIPELLDNYQLLSRYDFIMAKGALARELNAAMPIMEPTPEIDWYGAVHPVLALALNKQGRHVVPLDIRLTAAERILIISGPNAGGKSVCLKTVGINQYMLQCGMLPCLYSNSHAGVFRNICIDIGDEQSIENDLSTYSSHLRNMKEFLKIASAETLILVDEMGSGTEPQIGGALAQAIIARLNECRAMGVITTHYQNLKTFASDTPGLINGAMLYDRQHMQPLFKLAIGNPGSSFALEIAHKIGLPISIIENAKEIVGTDYVNMDKYLLDIARDRRYWQNKRKEAKEKENKLEAIIERYEQQFAELKSRRREIIEKARKEAADFLADTNKKVERTILEIRNAQAERERTKELRKELEEYKKKVEEGSAADPKAENLGLPKLPKRRKTSEKPAQKKPAPQPRPELQIGSYVRMSKGGTVGKILSISGQNAEVAFGSLRMRVALKKLTPAMAPVSTAATQTMSVSTSTTDDSRKRQLSFKQEIDLRGMRADEAIQAVTYFIDDALQFGISRVRILHGTGTGALRVAIRQYLQSVPGVSAFHDEDVRFGGAGITVVELA